MSEIDEIIDGEVIDIPEEALDETPQDAAPKKRGRPLGSKNASTTASGARRGRPRSNTAVKEMCAQLIGTLNLVASFVPSIPKEDLLDEQEMAVLTKAVTAEAMSSERIVKWMTTAAKASAHVLLVQAIIVILMPRLARRGMIPKGLVSNAPMDETAQNESDAGYPPDAAFSMEAGGTLSADGGYRKW